MATILDLAVHIITVDPVVSLVLLVVLIHSGDVFFEGLCSDLLNCERCIRIEDCWIDLCERCALRTCWFGGWYDLLELVVYRVTDELFPVIIILLSASIMMAGSFATTSEQIVCAIGL